MWRDTPLKTQQPQLFGLYKKSAWICDVIHKFNAMIDAFNPHLSIKISSAQV